MAEPKSLLDRIGDALKGDAEEKQEPLEGAPTDGDATV